jgi:hypothetical protein
VLGLQLLGSAANAATPAVPAQGAESPPESSAPAPSNESEPEQALPGGILRLFRDASAEDCPPAHSLASAVRAQLRAPRRAAANVVVSVNVSRDDGYYTGHIRVEGPTTGMRELRVPGPGCGALNEALVVTLALIFDEEANPPAAVPAPAPTTLPAIRASEPHTLALGIGASLVQGLPHALSGALSGELEFSSAAYSTAVGAFWTPTQHIEFEPGIVDIQLLGGQARACRFLWHDGTQSPRFAVCAEGLLGQLRGHGRNFETNYPKYRPWTALGPSAWLGSRLNAPLGWAVRGLVLFPLQRDAYTVAGIGEAYRMPAVSLGLEVLLRWRIL